MKPVRMVLVLVLPAVLMVALSACGGSSRAASGVLGIAVADSGGMITRLPSPSPLPDGFGLGQVNIGSGSTIRKLVVEPYSYGGVTIMVKATGGQEAGKVVARVNLAVGQDIFRVTLAPGTTSSSAETGPRLAPRSSSMRVTTRGP